MSDRWTIITEDTLLAAGHGAIIDAANNEAAGSILPSDKAIAAAVARVRGAISVGNILDRNASKVPNSLEGLTTRLALFALMERIQLPLTPDQRDTKSEDHKYLLQISAHKIRFEAPDDPAGSAEMQPGMSVGIVTSTPKLASRNQLSGL